jgi:hypothetical protein
LSSSETKQKGNAKMKSKYSGKCVRTGRSFGVGANVKWLGRGKGCILLDDSTGQGRQDWDGNPFNDAGEPMMTGEQYRREIDCMEQDAYYSCSGGNEDL